MNKKEIFKQIYKKISKMNNKEFKEKLEKHKHGDIAKSLQETGMAEYLMNEYLSKSR